jgi:hypothetical protein
MVGFGNALLMIPLILAVVLLFVSFILQWLWNITMPELFNLKQLSYWQALRLLLIASILFGGLGLRFIN